jgi:AcrR family transcriptional regulator
VLEQVARDAGLTRGALYHLFEGKGDLALASVDWVGATWDREVGEAVEEEPDRAAALLTLARRHAGLLPVRHRAWR